MDIFNYVMVLASVIIGLGITHLLQGVAGIVQNPGREKVYWVHLAWVGVVFLRAIFWWWFEYRLSDTAQWSFALYLFVLGYAFLIYLACALLFPRDLVDYEGYKGYYYSRRGWFFGVNLVGVAVDIADSRFKGIDYFRALGWSYLVIMAALATLFAIAMRTRSERYHAVLAVASLAYLMLYPIINYGTLQ